MQQLIYSGASVHQTNNKGETPLFYAAARVDQRLGSLLINNGAKVNKENAEGETPLFYAVNHRRIENIRLLIENGADVNHLNKSLSTPIFRAVSENYKLIVTYLIESGADVDLIQENGSMMLLYFAVFLNHQEIVTSLIEAGINVSQQIPRDAYGYDETVLHRLVKNNDVKNIELLIKAGALVNQVDKNGKTPLDWAQTEECISKLEEAGGVYGKNLVDKQQISSDMGPIYGNIVTFFHHPSSCCNINSCASEVISKSP